MTSESTSIANPRKNSGADQLRGKKALVGILEEAFDLPLASLHDGPGQPLQGYGGELRFLAGDEVIHVLRG